MRCQAPTRKPYATISGGGKRCIDDSSSIDGSMATVQSRVSRKPGYNDIADSDIESDMPTVHTRLSRTLGANDKADSKSNLSRGSKPFSISVPSRTSRLHGVSLSRSACIYQSIGSQEVAQVAGVSSRSCGIHCMISMQICQAMEESLISAVARYKMQGRSTRSLIGLCGAALCVDGPGLGLLTATTFLLLKTPTCERLTTLKASSLHHSDCHSFLLALL